MRGARRPILGMRTLQAFLTEGFVFLFKFSLALIEKTSDKLLACKVVRRTHQATHAVLSLRFMLY